MTVYDIIITQSQTQQKTALIKEAKMSKEERKERLENLCKQIDPMPDEQKSFIMGFMEGVCQMSEKSQKSASKEE